MDMVIPVGDEMCIRDRDDRMQRMAELDARKALLREKRVVLDEAFALALKKMQAMPAAQAKRYAMAVLLDVARGDETLIADADSTWCDAAFVREANAALAAAGREGKLRLSGEKRALGGGFLLVRGGMEVNCSFEVSISAFNDFVCSPSDCISTGVCTTCLLYTSRCV